jgi:hypothetical protein
MMGGPIGALRVLAAVYIFFDARRRLGFIAALLLAMGVMYVPVVVIPLYVVFKLIPIRFSVHTGGFAAPSTPSPQAQRGSLCPKCGCENPAGADRCSQCQNTLTL